MPLTSYNPTPPQQSFTDVDANNRFYRRFAVKDALRMGAIAALLGAAARGGVSLYRAPDLISEEEEETKPNRGVVTLPQNIKRSDVVEPAFNGVRKLYELPANLIGGVAESAISSISPNPERMSSPTDFSLYYPLMGLATIGGIHAGWKGVGKLNSMIRRRKLQADLERAKQQYRTVLDPSNNTDEEKVAFVNMIDKLAEEFEKDSGFLDTMAPSAQKMDGVLQQLGDAGGLGAQYPRATALYLALALPFTYSIGKKVYDHNLKSSPEYLKSRALKELRRRDALKPPQIEVDVAGNGEPMI